MIDGAIWATLLITLLEVGWSGLGWAGSHWAMVQVQLNPAHNEVTWQALVLKEGIQVIHVLSCLLWMDHPDFFSTTLLVLLEIGYKKENNFEKP